MIALYGIGGVGQAVRDLLTDRFPIAAIYNSKGEVYRNPDLDETILIDCTPGHYNEKDRAWIATLNQALAQGKPVITCNKAPLVQAWDDLHQHGTPILHSATVGGGTPILPTLARLQETSELVRMEASLSGTLSFVLAQVHGGCSLDDAIRQAQVAGFAEPDPTLDLNGTDAFAKAVLIHNLLFGRGPQLVDIPALVLEEDQIRSFAAPPQVVLEIAKNSIRWCIDDRLGSLTPGQAKAVAFTADQDQFEISGPGAGNRITATNLVADLIKVCSA